jgi:hypothetical protein
MSSNIYIPGSSNPIEPQGDVHITQLTGGVSFDTAGPEGEVQLRPVMLKPGQRARDVLLGNPQFQPFVVLVPYLLSRIDVEMKWDVCVIRGPSPGEVASTACVLWNSYIRPAWYPSTAGIEGNLIGERIDDGDWLEMLKTAKQLNEKDPQKYPVVALGVPSIGVATDMDCPYFFCIRGEALGYRGKMHESVYRQVSGGGDAFFDDAV